MENAEPESSEAARPTTPFEEEIAACSLDRGKRSPSGSKTPESTTGCRSPGSPIGDDACPICLGSFTDKCAAGSCLHNFCLVCLKEWAKQRPVCPLCKQSFTKILYDIKSETDYKEWKVPVFYPNELNDSEFRGFRQFLDHYERRFFGYRTTTLPWFSRRRNAVPAIYLTNNTDSIPTTHRSSRHQQQALYQDRGTSFFRLSVYTNNIWIQPLSDITGRYRESSPQLYSDQPGLTHRLVPWVNRELAALLPVSRIGVVLSDIMDLIERYPIDSREFRRTLRPHFGTRTRHFVHEFYNFARSPYDMVGHDSTAQYIPHYDEERESSDDDVIEVDSDGVVEFEPFEPLEPLEPLDLSSRVAREETIGNDGSVFISSDTDDGNSLTNDTSETHNPDPPYSASRLTSLLSRTRNLLSTICPASEERTQIAVNLEEPGPSGVSSSSSVSVKKERNNERNISDSDDCLIVDILKPKKERTPELIDLSSDSHEEGMRRGKDSSKAHWKKKISKQIEHKDSSKVAKGRKKPRLDRTSFSLHFSGTLNCQRGEDHTYCTESASPCNPSSNRTESEEEEEGADGEGDERNHNDQESRISKRNIAQRRKWNLVESDSENYVERSLESTSIRQRRTSVSKQRRHHRTSSRRIVESSVSPSNSPLRKLRKDRKSKVKNSSKITKSLSETPSKEGNGTSSSRQSVCKRRFYSSHSFRKDSSSKSFKRHRHDSSSSSSSSCKSFDREGSTSSSTSSSSSSSSSSSTASSSSSSSSSRSSSSSGSSSSGTNYDRMNSVSKSAGVVNLPHHHTLEDSSRSESATSLSSASPSPSSSDSEYLPSKTSLRKRETQKEASLSTRSVAKKNTREWPSTKLNPSKSKSKYKK